MIISDNTFENDWDGAQPGFAIVFTVPTKMESVRGARSTTSRSRATSFAMSPQASTFGLGQQPPEPADAGDSDSEQPVLRHRQQGVGRQWLLPWDDRRRTRYHRRSQHHRADECDRDRPIDGPPVLGFVYTNNLSTYGTYGIAGTATAPATVRSARICPVPISRGTSSREGRPRTIPQATAFFPCEFQTQFMSYLGFDYRLLVQSLAR